MKLRGSFTEEEARHFLMMIVKGFEDINQKNVVHRDLKLANVFVNFKDLSM